MFQVQNKHYLDQKHLWHNEFFKNLRTGEQWASFHYVGREEFKLFLSYLINVFKYIIALCLIIDE